MFRHYSFYKIWSCLLFVGYIAGVSAQNSYISKGVWLRIKVTGNAVYQLSYTSLKNAGLPIDNIDPRKITIIGNPGGMMPEVNQAYPKPGMQPIPIAIMGEKDGVFNNGDKVIAYLTGPHKLNMVGDSYYLVKNLYDVASYYYIGVLDTPAPRIQNASWTAQVPDWQTNFTDFVTYHDSDIYCPLEMGRRWFGEQMGNEGLKRQLQLPIPANAENNIRINYQLAGYCEFQPGLITANVDGNQYSHSIKVSDITYNAYETVSNRLDIAKPSDLTVDFTFEFNRQNSTSKAWVDYIMATGSIPIQNADGKTMIRSRDAATHNIVRYNTAINFSSDLLVWNVSNNLAIQNWTYFQNNAGKLSIDYPHLLKEATLTAFDPSQLSEAEILGKVENTDITSGSNPDLVIIVPNEYRAAAEVLAAHRRNTQGYTVMVCDINKIYHEFNGGGKDIGAIREFIKQLYVNGVAVGKPLKYALLMGATSYDFQNRLKFNFAQIPTYQRESDSKLSCYVVDDFFGYLKIGEGSPAVKPKNELTVSIGRIPCRSIDEANGVVQKLIRYDSKNALGPWRQEISFVADDIDNSSDVGFVPDCEKSSSSVAANHKEYNLNKFYLDAYKQVTSGNAEKYPDASRLIQENIQGQSLFLTYVGHGGETGLAQERIITLEGIKSWKNAYAMPVLFTATCEFGRFDNPKEQSGGELALLNPDGGAIAMLTTTRLINISDNSIINSSFWTGNGFQGIQNRHATIGEYFMRLKNLTAENVEMPKFSFLGDPSMPLAIPKNKITLDSINGAAYDAFTDTLKAFSKVTLKGNITDINNQLLSDFTGTLWIKVYDKAEKKFTQNNDFNGASEYNDYSGLIYKGTTAVTNGKYEVVFIVPKDISYKVGIGKISLYAHNGDIDACGYGEAKVGSSITSNNNDNQGPVVNLYMNDVYFVNGQSIRPNSVLLAKISDKDGLNTTGSGIGRDITAIIDQNTPNQKEFVLNNYFSYDLNSYTAGQVWYEMFDLSPGKHTLKLIAFDIFNNPGMAEITFEVGSNNELIIYSHSAFPNPFTDKVTLSFTHNFGNQDLHAEYRITDLSGRIVAKDAVDLQAGGNREIRVNYNAALNPESGGKQKLSGQMLFYRVEITTKEGSKAHFSGKLIHQ